MSQNYKKSGFTLVELMLAMGFVSALLLAIAMTVIQIGNIYNRGITYKNVNQVGGSIANELQRTISSVKSFDVISTSGPNYVKTAVSGRLCTGEYSYVWNYGKYLKNPAAAGTNFIKYQGLTVSDSPHIYFAKVRDTNSSVCVKVGAAYPDINRSQTTELINSSQYDLSVHDFSIETTKDNLATVVVNEDTAGDSATGQRLYSISFLLGTNNQDSLDANSKCRESGANADLTYCSVNRFNILARSGSATNAREGQ
jgi:type II secretory pathway pseudopilin PulG